MVIPGSLQQRFQTIINKTFQFAVYCINQYPLLLNSLVRNKTKWGILTWQFVAYTNTSPLRNCLIFDAYGSTEHVKYNKNTYTNTPKRLNYKRTKKQRVMKNFLQHFLFLFVFVSSTISINHLYMISVLASKYQLMCFIHGSKY